MLPVAGSPSWPCEMSLRCVLYGKGSKNPHPITQNYVQIVLTSSQGNASGRLWIYWKDQVFPKITILLKTA